MGEQLNWRKTAAFSKKYFCQKFESPNKLNMQPRILLVACLVVISVLVLPSEERVVRKGHAAARGLDHAKRGGVTPKDAGSDPRRNHPMATLKERAMLNKRQKNAESDDKRGETHPQDAGANLERNHPMAPLKKRAIIKGHDNAKRHDKREGAPLKERAMFKGHDKREGAPLKDGVNLQRSKFGEFDEFSYGDGNDTDRYSLGYSDGYAWAQSDNYYGLSYYWYYDVCPSRDPSLVDDEYLIGECDGYLYYMTNVNEPYDRYSEGYSDGYSWAQYDNSSGDHWYNNLCKGNDDISDDEYLMGFCDGYLYYMTYGGDYQYGDGNDTYDYDYDYYDGYWSGFWDGYYEAEYDIYGGYDADWWYDTYCGDYDYYSDDEYRSGFCDGYWAYKEGFLDGHSEGYSDAWHDIFSYYSDLH